MRVLIADDHGIVREGLKALIEKRDDLEVVGEAEDGRLAVDLARQLRPDMIIMDISMPSLNGVDATKAILQNNPKAKVIALSMHTDKHIVKGILDAGACGYVLKSNLFEEVVRAIEAVAAGQHYLSPRVTGVVVGDYVSGQEDEPGVIKDLTDREREVLQLVAEGKNIKQIALTLHISPKTADAHRRKVMSKLGVSGIAELVKYAIRQGLTSLDF